jgi:hypothetical protein
MAHKFSMIFSVAAFLVAWLSGLASGVPPDAILKRSLIGAAAFYVVGLLLCAASAAFLGFPGGRPQEPKSSRKRQRAQEGSPGNESQN